MELSDRVIAARLRQAQRVVVLTGGGLAAESGFPGFAQSQTGPWAHYAVSELATPQAFVRNPRLVWQWYAHRRALAAQCQPSASHRALAHLEHLIPEYLLVTQAIDGLHARSGVSSLVELNGSLQRSRCFESGEVFTSWEEEGPSPPICPHCGAALRPDVVMYGEGLPQRALQRVRQAVGQCEVLLCVGEIGAIDPVASLPFVARRAGALVVSIAPDESIYTILADHALAARPATALPAILGALRAPA
jgi:NAD-dependent deacetylase